MAIPPLVLRIYADTKGLTAGLAESQTKLQKFGATATKVGKIATVAVVGLGVASIKAASDLGESQNKANVIFGKSVRVVNKLGKESASAFGIANSEALSAAGGFGAMFDAATIAQAASADMSVTMVKLAADMASFNNEDPSVLLENLRSGLSGEAEPLRKFGVFISEARVQTEAYASGIAKAGEELTDAQKIQARYNIILTDTKKQQGDFARTSQSLPNQIRKMKAEFTDLAAKLGQALLPIVTKVVSQVSAWVTKFKNLDKPTRDMIIKVGLLVGAAFPLLKLVRGLGGAVGALGGAFKLSSRATALWTAALALAGIALVKLNGYMKQDDEQGQKWARNVIRGNSTLRDWRQAVDDVSDGHVNLIDHLDGTAKTMQALDHAAEEINQTFYAQVATLIDNTEVGARWERQLRDSGAMTINQKRNLAALLQTTMDYNVPLSDSQRITLEAYLATGDYTSALALLKGALAGVLGPLKNLHTWTQKNAESMADWEQKTGRQVAWLKSLGDIGPINIPVTTDDPRLRQAGGHVGAMRPYIVGEHGPEWFVPSVSGTVLPSSQTNVTAGATNVAVYVGEEQVRDIVVRALKKEASR